MTFDFSEVFTVATRRVVPLVLAKKLAFSFDCSTATVFIEGTPDAFQSACHRMFLAVVAMLQTGFVTLSATAQPVGSRIKITVRAGGIGEVNDAAVEQEVRAGLDLQTTSERGELRARGFWQPVKGEIHLHVEHDKGVLLTLEAETDGTWVRSPHEPSASGARVWFINAGDVMGTAWTRRFSRLGWAVSRFSTCEAAVAQLAQQPQSARPSVVVVVESGSPLTDGTSSLVAALPKWTRLVYAVPAGSARLREAHSVPGYEVHVFPFSPHQLDDFTVEREDRETPSGHTRPTPLESKNMPSILLVDDSPINLIVGQAMLEALGYAVVTAGNGRDAIRSCQTGGHPDLVLMDVNMPEMNGLVATERLRTLQRQGAMPPFPIVGFTAAWSEDLRSKCLEVGMDECLPKPLEMGALAPQLRRMVTLA